MPTSARQPLRHLGRLTSEEAGFSLVELMIVMLIIAILAAIALPAFGSQQEKAADARAKATAHAAEVAIEICVNEADGLYSSCNAKALRAVDPSLPQSPTLKVSVPPKGTSYTITIRSDPTSQTFKVRRKANGVVDYPCTVGGVGGCPASTKWG